MRHRFARFIIYAAARPAMAVAAACGVWVLMAARRKQSGNNSNRQSQSKSKSKSNCKSHASKYSAVAVYSGKQAKQLRQERQQTVCAVCCGSFKRVDDFCARIGTQQQQQQRRQPRAGKRAMRNAQRATCSWQWPPLWHKPNKWKLFKVCFGLWPPWRTG